MRLPDWTVRRSFGHGTLCYLDTTTVPNGVYTIRLRQQLANGTTQEDRARVTIEN